MLRLMTYTLMYHNDTVFHYQHVKITTGERNVPSSS